MRNRIYITSILMTFFVATQAQLKNDYIQFSGVVVTSDSLHPVPFANIAVSNTSRGTSSDYWGFFSLVVRKTDEISFSAIGYKSSTFRIPDTLSANRYSMIQVMSADTLILSETVIYPWPSKEQFKHAFLNNEIPDDDIELARKNLEFLNTRELYGRNYDAERYGNTPKQSYRNRMNTESDKLYYKGQAMPNNLLNPFAWAKFVKAWKRGDFKQKK